MIWSRLYQKLHTILSAQKANCIGVAFPGYTLSPATPQHCRLGERLRLFGTEAQLQALDLQTALRVLQDYIHLRSIQPVPVKKISGYAIYRRRQAHSSPERLARRSVKTGRLPNLEVALAKYQHAIPGSTLPYVQLFSESTEQRFSLFIEKITLETVSEGEFNTYGLSKGGSVPEF